MLIRNGFMSWLQRRKLEAERDLITASGSCRGPAAVEYARLARA
jgi:hypothetical protein